jgi:hypothetical protein
MPPSYNPFKNLHSTCAACPSLVRLQRKKFLSVLCVEKEIQPCTSDKAYQVFSTDREIW